MKLTVLNLEPENYSSKAVSLLTKDFSYHSANNQNLDKAKIHGIITRLGYHLDKNFLKNFNNLKFIATNTTGLNHIDVEYAKHNKIEIISLKGETNFLKKISPTAEHTFGLILALAKKYNTNFDLAKKSQWDREKYLGTTLRGKTIGIIGMGRIGKMVAKYSDGFGMKIIYSDTKKIKSKYKQVSFKQILKLADILTIHIPYSKNSVNLLSEKEFLLMKKNCILINTSRGGLVNEKALIDWLQCNPNSSAALDVIQGEEKWQKKIPSNNIISDYLKKYDNLIVTPHIGGACPDAMRITEEFIAQKIIKKYKKSDK